MERKKATRKAVPLCVAIGAPTGQGKTYSALLMAAGLAKGGKIGFLDTEHGRGSMYADDAEIMKAMPQGYDVIELTEPYTPERYIEAIRALSDCDVIVVDSTTHEWEGSGGCTDIAENNKLGGMPNWAKAKMAHKRFMNVVTQSSSYIVFCLRAREKTKPGKDDKGKTIMIECGMQPIQEKNFMFEMTVSMLLDESYRPIITKCPRPLQSLFSDGRLITKETGEKLRAWAESGESIDKMLRQLKQQCREAAMEGNVALDKFFQDLPQKNKETLKNGTDKDFQIEVRSLAKEADDALKGSSVDEQAEEPDALFNEMGSPAEQKATEITTLIFRALNSKAVDDIVQNNEGHIAAMNDEYKKMITAAVESRKHALKK